MKEDKAVSSVLGSILIIGLIAIAATAGAIFAITTVVNMADEAPLAMFESSEIKNMMYHSGGDTIDLANTLVYYKNQDVTGYCYIADYAGGPETKLTNTKDWKTGQVLVVYLDENKTKLDNGEELDQDCISIVTSDGGNAYVVLKKGEGYVPPQKNSWILTVICREEGTDKILKIVDIVLDPDDMGDGSVNLDEKKGMINVKNYKPVKDEFGTYDYNIENTPRPEVTFYFTKDGNVKHKVTFDAGGGTFAQDTPGLDKDKDWIVTREVEDKKKIENEPSDKLLPYDNNKFDGWYDKDGTRWFDENGDPVNPNYEITGDLELIAHWTIGIKFNLGDGEWKDSNPCDDTEKNIIYTDENGNLIVLPMNVEYTGEGNKVFDGWEYGGKVYKTAEELKKDFPNGLPSGMVLNAHYSDVYTVVFNPNGATWKDGYGECTGTSNKLSVNVVDGKVTAPGKDALNYGNNEFYGWYDQDGNKVFDENGNLLIPDYDFTKAGIELTARWHYAITFLPNGGKWSDGTSDAIVIHTKTEESTGKEYLDLSDFPRNLKKDNYVFKGWPYNGNVYETNKFAVSAYKGTAIDTRLYFDQAQTLSAQWARGTMWTIIFHPCGGKWPGDSNYAKAYDLYKSTGNRQYLLDQIIVVKVMSDSEWGPGANDAIYELITNHLGLGDKIPVLSDTSTIPELSSYYMPYKVNSDGSRGKPMDDTWYEFFVYRHDPAGTQYNTIGEDNEDHVWADMAYKSPEYLQSAEHKKWWAENKDKGWTENFWGDFSRVSYNSLSHYSWDDKYANNDPVHTVIYAAADHATIYPEKDVVNELRDKGLIITTEAKY